MFTRRLPVHLIAVLISWCVFASSAATADDKWIQVGSGIFSSGTGGARGRHHQSGRLAQVSWSSSNLWVGASHGGLWKSIINESGFLVGWVPLTDNFPGSHTLGSFAVMKGNPSNIVIGTGSMGWGDGNGIYYTTDGGSSWQAASQPSTPDRVSRIVADSFDASGLTLVAATSDGIWQSFDFGKTWFSRLSGVEATDVVQDTGDQHRWYAGVVDKGIYLSTDYAVTWASHGSGITGNMARISLAACALDHNFLYALVVNNGNKLNGVYRSKTSGSKWVKIYSHNKPINHDHQGKHTCAIACDPADPAHIFFGLVDVAEMTNATADPSVTDADGNATVIDGGHSDYNFILFHEDGKHLHIANDGGYYFYDFVQHTVDDRGNLLGLNNLELASPKIKGSTLQGGLASSSSNPDFFVAGLQDNGVVQGGFKRDPAITLVVGGDGRHVSIDPSDHTILGFADNGSNSRYLSLDGGLSAQGIDFNLTLEKSASVLIDPTPGVKQPHVFTADLNVKEGAGVQVSGVYYNDTLSPASPWKLVGQAVPTSALISNVDMSASTDRYRLVLSVANAPTVFRFGGVRDQGLGALALHDITPPIPLDAKNADGRINADRSTDEPNTLYYTSGSGTPPVAYVSHDGGDSWIEVTGDIATVSDNARLLKLISYPGSGYLLYLATSKGVFRSADRGRHWTDYSEGLRRHEQVDDIVINYRGAIGRTTVSLLIVTRGRGIWRRTAN